MASKRMDLNKRCFFVLSGVSNDLSQTLAVEMCRRFKSGSIALLIEESSDHLEKVKEKIDLLKNDIEVLCCNIGNWQTITAKGFCCILDKVLQNKDLDYFEMAFILHNEGTIAIRRLMEPDEAATWQEFVQQHLYAVVALNQEFLKQPKLMKVEKLVINMTSSLLVKPFVFNSLMCSCLKARDMYFRAMAAEELRNNVVVLTYSPGIFATHQPEFDINNNTIDLEIIDAKKLKLPHVEPIQATLKLINILQEISFISGHDVDYYDTFNL